MHPKNACIAKRGQTTTLTVKCKNAPVCKISEIQRWQTNPSAPSIDTNYAVGTHSMTPTDKEAKLPCLPTLAISDEGVQTERRKNCADLPVPPDSQRPLMKLSRPPATYTCTYEAGANLFSLCFRRVAARAKRNLDSYFGAYYASPPPSFRPPTAPMSWPGTSNRSPRPTSRG